VPWVVSDAGEHGTRLPSRLPGASAPAHHDRESPSGLGTLVPARRALTPVVACRPGAVAA